MSVRSREKGQAGTEKMEQEGARPVPEEHRQ